MTSSAQIRVYPANFVRGPSAVEEGQGGGSTRGEYLRVRGSGLHEYVWYTQNDGSTSPGVDAGIDPGDYEADLSGATGRQVTLGSGGITAAAKATALAAVIDALSWTDTVTVAGSDNADGSRSIDVEGSFDYIEMGGRAWADRGASGIHGSHVSRRVLAAEIAGAGDTGAITRNVAQRLGSYPSGRIHAVSILLGATVSTTAANILRLYLRSGDSSTTIPGPTMLYDFGQLAVSEVVAGRRATIRLTPAQSDAVTAAIAGATGQLWLCCKCAATTTLGAAMPTGGGWEGECSDQSARIDVVTSGAGNTAAPANWNNTGAFSPGTIIGMALHYEADPPSNGGRRLSWGPNSAVDLTSAGQFPDEVTLGNTVTTQTSQLFGHAGARIHAIEAGLVSGDVRYGVYTGGDVTTDADDPDLTGATPIWDTGEQAASAGLNTFLAPTGDSSVRAGTVLSAAFKGDGATGRGAADPRPDLNPITACDWVQATGGVPAGTDGDAPWEQDYAGLSGDPSTAMPTLTGATTQPDNVPAFRVVLEWPASVATMLGAAETGASLDATAAASAVASAAATAGPGLAAAMAATVEVTASMLAALGLHARVSFGGPVGVPWGEALTMSDAILSFVRGAGAGAAPTATRIDLDGSPDSQALSPVPTAPRGAAAIAGFVSVDEDAVLSFYDGDPDDSGTLLCDYAAVAGQIVPLAALALFSSHGLALWVRVESAVVVRGRAVTVET